MDMLNKMIVVYFILILLFFWYTDKKSKRIMAARNRKYRFNFFTVALIKTIPIFFLIIFFFDFNFINQEVIALTKEMVTLFLILYLVLMEIMYASLVIPANKEKYLKNKEKMKRNQKNWEYYLIENSAWTLFKIYDIPPMISRLPSKEKYRKLEGRMTKWYKDRIKNPRPPVYVQMVLFLVVFLITTAGLYVLGYIGGDIKVIMINITIVPFVLILLFVVNFIKMILEFIEFMLSIFLRKIEFKLNQRFKFIIINVSYIIMVYFIYGYIIKFF